MIRPKKAQLVGLNIPRTLCFVAPSSFACIIWPLRENDIIVIDPFFEQARGIWDYLLVANDGLRCWKGSDDVRIPAFQVLKIM